MVLPSKGFYNLVNGAYGIGIGASSSVPQYNLKELNEALIKLLWNPDISFDEITGLKLKWSFSFRYNQSSSSKVTKKCRTFPENFILNQNILY